MSNFNLQDFIGHTIESVLAQTYSNWELIAVDDGSSDKSGEIILDYAKQDPRIKPLILKENQGMCTGFNLAIATSRGNYLARIDSDDMWHKDKLEKQIAYMEAHPETGISFTWVKVVDEDGNPVPPSLCEYRDQVYNSQNRTQAEWIRTFYFEGCRVCHPTAVYRREVIEAVGFYSYTHKQTQDLDLWIRIAQKYPIHILCEPLIQYRWFLKRGENASKHSNATSLRSACELFITMAHFHDNLSDELFAEAFHQDFFYAGSKTHEELLCERALLLYHKSYLDGKGRILALQKLSELLNHDVTRAILKEHYNVTLKTFAEWTSYPLFIEDRHLVEGNSVLFREKVKKKLRKFPLLHKILSKIYWSLLKKA